MIVIITLGFITQILGSKYMEIQMLCELPEQIPDFEWNVWPYNEEAGSIDKEFMMWFKATNE